MRKHRKVSMALALLAVMGLLAAGIPAAAGPGEGANDQVRLPGHVPNTAIAAARYLNRAPAQEQVDLALALPLRNQAALSDLLDRLYDPNDPLYGKYLTPEQATEQFAPAQADYNALAAWAGAHGLAVTGTHPNRLLLDVAGTARAVETAFNVRLGHYQAPDGRVFRAPDRDPAVPAAIAARLSSVAGLDTVGIWHPHSRLFAANVPVFMPPALLPRVIGTGPGGGVAPKDIRNAYNLNAVAVNGSGQTLGLFELDGYTAGDITHYEQFFGLPNVPLQNVLVDGFSGAAGSGAGEVTLDIELMTAIAPGAAKILVYEGPNSTKGVLDTYSRIQTDNHAKQISTSWGLYESGVGAANLNSENNIFSLMSVQGQSIYAASGDNGAYDDGFTLSVDDPASQPFVSGAGGTTLATNGAGGTWKSETTWANIYGGSGGGISSFWPIPAYQKGVVSAASQGSTTMRNVPDVALNADPTTGYAIYFQGAWNLVGGTSCAAPLWAGFTALVNQQRTTNGLGVLGSANPALYNVGKGAHYNADFHDIADGSNNYFYPAVAGYDDATGWGSFNGANLLADLAPANGGGGGGPQQLLGNPGFENGANTAPWVANPTSIINNNPAEPAHTGTWKAWLDGANKVTDDTLYQQVSIPANITSATLSFWLHIDTADPSTTTKSAILQVQIRNSSGTVLSTLGIYSNLNAAAGYVQHSFNVLAYKGQTIRVYLVGVQAGAVQTSFVVDDFALNVQ